MKLSYTRLPVDILLLMIWGIIVIPFSLLNTPDSFRVILGLPFILFIPGYVLVFALFPARKTDHGIDTLERVVLSFGLSIAVVPLIGLLLNYTPWGIRLEPILLSLLLFILGIGLVGIYRWTHTPTEDRFIITLDLSLPHQHNKTDQALTLILIIVIIIVLASLVYVITIPKTGETFTEFYLLGPAGKAEGYPRNLTTQQNATVIIGVANHEQRQITYNIEIWLLNQTTQDNQTITHQMWYLDTITTTLPHHPLSIEEPWSAQWTEQYTFRINTTGTYKLAFLLFTNATQTYDKTINYQAIAEEKLSSAYRTNHLWITVR